MDPMHSRAGTVRDREAPGYTSQPGYYQNGNGNHYPMPNGGGPNGPVGGGGYQSGQSNHSRSNGATPVPDLVPSVYDNLASTSTVPIGGYDRDRERDRANGSRNGSLAGSEIGIPAALAQQRGNGSNAGSQVGMNGGWDDQSVVDSIRGGFSGSGGNANRKDVRASKIILHTTPRRSSVKNQPAQLVSATSFGGTNHFPLIREETYIGRKDDNQIVLNCNKISKYHAVVKRTDNGYTIRDRNSSNGIRINNVMIDPNIPRALNDGDKIDIGTINLIFVAEGKEAPEMAANPVGRSDHRYSRYSRIVDENVKLVTILPSEKKYEETVTVSAEIPADDDSTDFVVGASITDMNTLKEDYEKLRLAYELSKISLTNDITPLLAKSLDLMFEILPIDRGVVLLVDENTGNLAPHYVKLREGKQIEKKEILLSSTILRRVFDTRIALISKDACEDPMLGKAASVKYGQIRSVICVPLTAHNKVHGILHLDSRDRMNNSFSSKDLALVKAISNQTAVAIENSILIKEVEQKAKITEQLSRFLAPHVVDRMTSRGNPIQRGGRELVGTIIFADIRGFTNLSEKVGPQEVVNLLNDYFERLVDIVFKYEGVVDKYIGDALMAVFGSMEDETDAEWRSVAAALEFKEGMREMNDERKRQGKDIISIGVGVNTGELLCGFIGSSQRLEYTCIGDTVNTTSRICDMSSKDQILISETTYQAVKEWVVAEPVGYRQFKGKTTEVMVYEAISIRPKN
ncbi:hypothetical protein HK101_003114 [Irineochytrium annulatum]|nr:hypothetical protein HK101_003114 [Irineochytrium annulatum]